MAMHATVIGAGIGGLATALALRRTGWDVDVLERADGPSRNGTALGIWPAAMSALERLGAAERVRRRSAQVRGGRILAPDGRVLTRIPQSMGVHLISRASLLSALLAELPHDVVHWSHPLDVDDRLPDADLVVGADGARSTVRARVWGSTSPRPLGTIAYRGVADRATESVSETWGTGTGSPAVDPPTSSAPSSGPGTPRSRASSPISTRRPSTAASSATSVSRTPSCGRTSC